MGVVRGYSYDAVIGIGGSGGEARANGIAYKLNWIGVGPHRHECPGGRGPLVTFDRFVSFEDQDLDLRIIAPDLAQRMYVTRPARLIFDESLSPAEQTDVKRLLKRIKNSPPSVRTNMPKRIKCFKKAC